MKIKSLKTLNKSDRITSIDIFRGIAIISVVIFHFNHYLPFGYLGVDLFFVISGLLVGGILTRQNKTKGRINYLKFFIQRAGKIWPSYYIFIFIGSILAILFYSNTEFENQIIPVWDLKRYLFFYQNYTGFPTHWSFDHVWSICVEEHFYLILPLMFIFVRKFFNNKTVWLFVLTAGTIILGVFFKYISLKYTNSHDTYSGTHNRIDALAWGVLLNLLLVYYSYKIKQIKYSYIISIIGLLLFSSLIYFYINTDSIIYQKVLFQSFVPFSFFLIILGVYYVDFSKLLVIRLIAYYSYNWYLWHPVFSIYITDKFGNSFFSLSLYMFVTFIVAMFFTIIIEEPMLKYRSLLLNRLFPKKDKEIN